MKQLIPILTCVAFTSCMTNYPMTTFYVKNNTNKTINFKATIEKLTSMGMRDMTLPFTVLPMDSVLARKIGIKNGAEPTVWFTEFVLFPIDSVQFNDPTDAKNWVRSTDVKGKPVYTFNVAK
ncbi:MAG: hypothetical protein QM802_19250 [Agriterribacter sp.]